MSNEIVAKQRFWRKKPHQDLGSPWLIVFNVVAIFIVSQIFAALIVQAFLSVAKITTALDNSAAAEFFYVLLAEGIAALLVFKIVRRRGLGLSVIGLGRWPRLRDLSSGLLGFGGFYVLLIVSAGLVSFFYPDLNKGTQDVGFNHLRTTTDTVIALFALVLLPPLGEEVLVRGYLFSGLSAKMKYLPALLITSLLFGAAHLSGGNSGVLWAAGLNTFVLSVVLVYLRRSTGALWAGMLVHMLNNLIAFGVHFHL